MSYSEKYTAKIWQNQGNDGTIADDAPKMNAANIQYFDNGIKGAYEALDEVSTYFDNKIVFGTYTGDGNASQFIELGFMPKAVLVVAHNGVFADEDAAENTYYYGGLALSGQPCFHSYDNTNHLIISIETNGFRVYTDNFGSTYARQIIKTNSTEEHYYIAFR